MRVPKIKISFEFDSGDKLTRTLTNSNALDETTAKIYEKVDEFCKKVYKLYGDVLSQQKLPGIDDDAEGMVQDPGQTTIDGEANTGMYKVVFDDKKSGQAQVYQIKMSNTIMDLEPEKRLEEAMEIFKEFYFTHNGEYPDGMVTDVTPAEPSETTQEMEVNDSTTEMEVETADEETPADEGVETVETVETEEPATDGEPAKRGRKKKEVTE